MNGKQVALCSFGVALLLYSAAIGIYECEMGGIAAGLTIEYYDQSFPISEGSPIRIAIDSLPRNIYKNTKETAYVMLFCGVLGLIATIATVVYTMFKRDVEEFIIGAAASNAPVIAVPFCFSAFLTWKFHSMSDADTATWDSVDTGFVDNLARGEGLMIATVVPGVFWIIAYVVMWCAMRRN